MMKSLTDLETRLNNDTSGTERDGLLVQLSKAEEKLLEQLHGNRNPAQRQQVYILVEACQQSRQTITVLWKRYHLH